MRRKLRSERHSQRMAPEAQLPGRLQRFPGRGIPKTVPSGRRDHPGSRRAILLDGVGCRERHTWFFLGPTYPGIAITHYLRPLLWSTTLSFHDGLHIITLICATLIMESKKEGLNPMRFRPSASQARNFLDAFFAFPHDFCKSVIPQAAKKVPVFLFAHSFCKSVSETGKKDMPPTPSSTSFCKSVIL